MPDLHIDEFYKDVARILVSLFGVFPRPVTLYVEDIAGPDEPDEYGVHSNRYQACFATLCWLQDEGYLRYADTIRQEAVDQTVLTGRAFSALLAPAEESLFPQDDSLSRSEAGRRQSYLFQLRHALEESDSAALARLVPTFMTGQMTPQLSR